MRSTRDRLAADRSLVGGELCRVYSDEIDRWLRDLLLAAVEGDPTGVALVAVGGYGRGELSLQSDIDVVLLHDERRDVTTVADRIWYPIWDEGLKLGHAVRTIREALVLASDDLDTATSLLDARHVAGDASMAPLLHERALAQWQKRSKRWLAELASRVRDRHARAGEVAFLLEPDLKEGRGGLRDVHALRWAQAARSLLWEGDDAALDNAYDVLLSVRVELHRHSGRAGDRLLLQEQDALASVLGNADADELMRRVSSAARTIAWTSDDAWSRIESSLAGPLGRRRRDKTIDSGLALRDGEIHLAAGADPAADPSLALRAAAAAATRSTRIHRASLDRLATSAPAMPDPWPDDARAALVELLSAGRPAIGVLEALDQKGVWTRLLPEWEPNRSRPQRNAYHRFTVDRHLWETAIEAGVLTGRVERPDLLVLGALLHDIGKGYPGDHTEAGLEILERLAPRLGLPPADVDVLLALCRHHLLLADVATRRDLDDPATVIGVAEAVGSVTVLELLAALTEADSLATGPAAWGTWKADLVRELVRRTTHVLGGGAPEEVAEEFPNAEQLALLGAGEQVVRGEGDVLTVVAPDRPGLFARVAGVLALHGLDVLDAAAATRDGMGLEVFRVESAFGPGIAWAKVLDDLELALAGKLALHARLAERARVYERPSTHPTPIEPRIAFDNDASSEATVVEVHAPDGIGVLYRITRALTELDLDIVSAKVQTLGPEVVDSFYVRDAEGRKLTEPDVLVEVERALLHGLTSA